MKKRGRSLIALGIAVLLAVQTPAVAAVQSSQTSEAVSVQSSQESTETVDKDPDDLKVQKELPIQKEYLKDDSQSTKEKTRIGDDLPPQESSNAQTGYNIKNASGSQEEVSGMQDAEKQQEMSGREQTEYTWEYDPDIGWQLWQTAKAQDAVLCEPGIYILEDGIYYLAEYQKQDDANKELPGEEHVIQSVLTNGSVQITKDTPVVSVKEEKVSLAEGTYYFSYEMDETKEDARPRHGEYLCDTWVHPGEDTSIWYYVNSRGLEENPQDHAGAAENEYGYFYLDSQGRSQSGRYTVDGSIYIYDGNGNRVLGKDGWQQESGKWYYIENGKLAAGWKKINGAWYYLNLSDGIMKTGFFKDHTGTLYFADDSGRMISGNGWKKIQGNWYWLRTSGAIVRGWVLDKSKWYYLDPDSGMMRTGWYQVNGSWYYSDGSGAMQTGWLRLGSTWYYLNGSGAMQTGWLRIGNTWYYLDAKSGGMRTGWYQVNGSWYYSDGSGAMQTGWLRLGSTWYYLNGSGAMQTGWLRIGNTWYYLDVKSGGMRTGWYQVNETWYYSNGSGAMQTGWLRLGSTWYYLNGSGAALTGWQAIGGVWYYFYPSCAMAANTWIDNYYVNSSGAWVDSTVVMPGAAYNYPFPTAKTKKGLQIKDDTSDADMVDDAANLGVKHAVINIALNYVAFGSGIEYEYQGETYYMNTGYVHELDSKIKKLHDDGMIITAVLVLQWDYQKQDLILPSARTYGYSLYGWNTVEQEGRKHLEAICSFLAERYAAPDMGVVNWICGNEVNAWRDYHYSGNVSFDQYMEYYAQAYQLLYNCVKHAYSNGRVYMSIDHTWTYDRRANCYTSKSVLDRFAQLMRQKGIPDWMIAFHPYPSPELQSDFWNRTLNVIDSENSPIITMANLSYFTNYVKKNYGEGRRILLSECGFTSVTNGIERQDIQAAAIAYGYYIAEANDMVDSFVVHRQVDHSQETVQGFHLGLWTCKPGTLETPYQKKQAYDVFKYMDTRYYMTYTKFALPLIKKTSWEQAVPGFNPSKFL